MKDRWAGSGKWRKEGKGVEVCSRGRSPRTRLLYYRKIYGMKIYGRLGELDTADKSDIGTMRKVVEQLTGQAVDFLSWEPFFLEIRDSGN